MLLRERIFEHPEALLASCLVWVPIAIWIYALISWMIQGDIDFISGLVGVTLGLGVGLVAMIAPDVRVAPLIFVACMITLIAAPLVRMMLSRRELNSIDIDAIERAYEALAEKPMNPGLRMRLAKTLYNRGMVAHAIALADDALQHLPKATFEEEHRMVAGWKRTKQAAEPAEAIACMDCGTLNEPGLTHCKKCGARFLLEYARGRWVGRGLARKFIAGWAALMVGIVVVPWLSMALPPAAAIPAIVVLVAVVITLLVLAFRTEEMPKTA
jgi:hypothetical protein